MGNAGEANHISESRALMGASSACSVRVAMVTISTAFRFKGCRDLINNQMHRAKHFGKYMIGFNFEVIGLELNRYVAIPQVIRRAYQIKRRAARGAGRDLQDSLWGRLNANQSTVLGHQDVT